MTIGPVGPRTVAARAPRRRSPRSPPSCTTRWPPPIRRPASPARRARLRRAAGHPARPGRRARSRSTCASTSRSTTRSTSTWRARTCSATSPRPATARPSAARSSADGDGSARIPALRARRSAADLRPERGARRARVEPRGVGQRRALGRGAGAVRRGPRRAGLRDAHAQDDGTTASSSATGAPARRCPPAPATSPPPTASAPGVAGRVRARHADVGARPPAGPEGRRQPAGGARRRGSGADRRTRARTRRRPCGRSGARCRCSTSPTSSATRGQVAKAQATWVWDGFDRAVHLTVAGQGGGTFTDEDLRLARRRARPRATAELPAAPGQLRARCRSCSSATIGVDAPLRAHRRPRRRSARRCSPRSAFDALELGEAVHLSEHVPRHPGRAPASSPPTSTSCSPSARPTATARTSTGCADGTPAPLQPHVRGPARAARPDAPGPRAARRAGVHRGPGARPRPRRRGRQRRMTATRSPDRLYELLPAVFREQDADQRRAAARAAARSSPARSTSSSRTSPGCGTTCSSRRATPWVIAYIGDLVSNTLLYDPSRIGEQDTARGAVHRPARPGPAAARRHPDPRRRRQDDLLPPAQGHAADARGARARRHRLGRPRGRVLRAARLDPAPRARPPAGVLVRRALARARRARRRPVRRGQPQRRRAADLRSTRAGTRSGTSASSCGGWAATRCSTCPPGAAGAPGGSTSARSATRPRCSPTCAAEGDDAGLSTELDVPGPIRRAFFKADLDAIARRRRRTSPTSTGRSTSSGRRWPPTPRRACS